jgi:hypothetical protein
MRWCNGWSWECWDRAQPRIVRWRKWRESPWAIAERCTGCDRSADFRVRLFERQAAGNAAGYVCARQRWRSAENLCRSGSQISHALVFNSVLCRGRVGVGAMGSFAWNVTLSVVARLFYYGVVCAALIALRRKHPMAPSGFPAAGWPTAGRAGSRDTLAAVLANIEASRFK